MERQRPSCRSGENFGEAFEQLDADFFCIQETKMQEGQLDLSFPGYNSYWNYADKKGYSGTAILTHHTPLNVTYDMRQDEHDHEGRLITLEIQDFFLVCCYMPNSQSADEFHNLQPTTASAQVCHHPSGDHGQ